MIGLSRRKDASEPTDYCMVLVTAKQPKGTGKMARTGFALGNANGQEVGPALVADNTEIAGLEVREQAGFGLIDARLHYRNSDGSSIPGGPHTDWLTDNTGATRVGMVTLPTEEVFTGLRVYEQAGFGIVNLRVRKKKRDGTSADESDLVVDNQTSTRTEDIDIPAEAIARGIVGREQAGHGLVDIAIDYRTDAPSQTEK